MSMDDQYQQLIRFTKELDRFNQLLNASVHDLDDKHSIVSPLWQDEMRKDYDRDWEPLKERMDSYVKLEGQRYVDFLQNKIRLLERYLHGR